MSNDGNSVLRALELLWDEGPRPSRGPKPSLSIAQVVEAAIELADAEGLEALTMRRVAERLGFTTMSLYRYLPGKEELVEVMRDVALGPPPASLGARPRSWREGLVRWSHAILEVHHRHTWLLAMELRGPPFGPNHLHWFETALQILTPLGLDGRLMVSLVIALDSYVRGAASVRVGVAREARRMGQEPAQLRREYGRILERALRDERYPTMRKLAADGALTDEPPARDEFAFGLERLLDSFEALAPPRPPPAPRRSRA